ncbi:hypothetical protein WEI85_16265 [Actinomycetes bacterium KLBMP 9797]
MAFQSAAGWPFLVGAGRRRDYTTLLAPDFLLDAGEYAVLAATVGPTADDDPPRVLRVTTRSGRPLALAYVTRLVTVADVAWPGAPGGPDPARPLRDEYGRLLRVMVGFACPDGDLAEVAPDDIERALGPALTTYRRFLDDEEGFRVQPSSGFALRSPILRRTPAAPAHAAAAPTAPVQPPDHRKPQSSLATTVALGATAAVAVLAVWFFATQRDADITPIPTPTATPSTLRS